MKLWRSSPTYRFTVLTILVVAAFGGSGCNQNTLDSSVARKKAAASAETLPALKISATDSPAGADSREPEMTTTPDGRIILSWVEKISAKRYALRFATRDAGKWSSASTVVEGENWFVNWADFPSVIALNGGSLAAHWLVKSGIGTYAYEVNIATSKGGGNTWGKPIVPHTDKTQTEHGFVSLLPLPDGRLGAVWLDGRNLENVKEDHGEGSPLPANMTLRYAAIDADNHLSDEAQLDDRVCECCQTSAALTSEGAIVAYRDRSDSEVRDIYIVRLQQGKWTEPSRVHADNWEINGCPVNGPSVAADGRRVVIAWYTEANNSPRVKAVFSNDAGATFSAPVEVDDGEPLGRVDALLLPDGSALICWMAGTTEGGSIKVRLVRPDGSPGPPSVIAETNISRSSGFPRMARLGDEIHFAWTEFGKPSNVRTATADINVYKR